MCLCILLPYTTGSVFDEESVRVVSMFNVKINVFFILSHHHLSPIIITIYRDLKMYYLYIVGTSLSFPPNTSFTTFRFNIYVYDIGLYSICVYISSDFVNSFYFEIPARFQQIPYHLLMGLLICVLHQVLLSYRMMTCPKRVLTF